MAQPGSHTRRTHPALLWALLGACYAATLTTGRDLGPWSLLIAWIPVAFAAAHLIAWVGPRTAGAVFAVITIVSYTYEAVGVATGLIFGNYHYPSGPLGPLLLGVPPLIQLQYFAMGYASLLVGRAITGHLASSTRGLALLTTSAMSAFTMTALDLASDPMQSTVLGDWIWRDGGAYFGVPPQNFAGWLACTGTFFLIVNWLLSRGTAATRVHEPQQTRFYLQGILLFGTFPTAIILRPILTDTTPTAQAMATVAAFAILPILLAALANLRRATP